MALLGFGLLAGCGGGGGGNGGGDETPVQLSAHEVAQSRAEMAKRAALQNTSFVAAVVKNDKVGVDQRRDSTTVVFAQEGTYGHYVNIDGEIGGVPMKRGIGPDPSSLRSGLHTANGYYEVDGTIYELSMYAPASASDLEQKFVEAGAGYFLDREARELGLVAFTAGEATPIGDVPMAGSAHYRGSAVGYYFGDSSANLTGFAGELSTAVDFAQKTTGLEVDALYSVSPGNSQRLPGFSGSGTISGNGFTGTLTQAGGGSMTGDYDGQFYGPQAAEVGGTFALSNSEGALVGSFAGKK
jgi:hypothetical protein